MSGAAGVKLGFVPQAVVAPWQPFAPAAPREYVPLLHYFCCKTLPAACLLLHQSPSSHLSPADLRTCSASATARSAKARLEEQRERSRECDREISALQKAKDRAAKAVQDCEVARTKELNKLKALQADVKKAREKAQAIISVRGSP